MDCTNPEHPIKLLNSRVGSASAFDPGPGNDLSNFQKTVNRFARNHGAFQTSTALSQKDLGKLPSFSSQFKFTQPFRSDVPSIPPYSSRLSTLAGIAASPYNIVQPAHIAQSHNSKSSNSGRKFTAVSKKTASASFGHLCEYCFRPGDHSKTCPQFVREQEEKERQEPGALNCAGSHKTLSHMRLRQHCIIHKLQSLEGKKQEHLR